MKYFLLNSLVTLVILTFINGCCCFTPKIQYKVKEVQTIKIEKVYVNKPKNIELKPLITSNCVNRDFNTTLSLAKCLMKDLLELRIEYIDVYNKVKINNKLSKENNETY